MNPNAFSLFGVDIKWYAVMIMIGLLVGLEVAKHNSKFRNIDYGVLLDMTFVILPIALIGARLYYVIFEWERYSSNLISILNIRGGGLAIHGGILFAVITAIFLARRKKIKMLDVLDVAAPSLILAQAFGRWGNFFNSEAYGGPVSADFIHHFPEFIQKGMLIGGTYHHPTFLYESIWNLLVFIILMVVLRKSKRSGLVAFSYLGLYSIGRFVIEGMRTDSLMLGPIRVAQAFSLVGILAWIVFLSYPFISKIIRMNLMRKE